MLTSCLLGMEERTRSINGNNRNLKLEAEEDER